MGGSKNSGLVITLRALVAGARLAVYLLCGLAVHLLCGRVLDLVHGKYSGNVCLIDLRTFIQPSDPV